jgi:hypothetical protein
LILLIEITVRYASGETVPKDRCAATLSGLLDWRQISIVRIWVLAARHGRQDTACIGWKGEVGMQRHCRRQVLRGAIALAVTAAFSASTIAAIKNMAVVASASSKLTDVPLADLVKMCKGTSKAWPDGKNFVLVLKNPDALEMHGALTKLFGGVADVKAAITKLNETHQVVKVVDTDDELLRTVDGTPGAIGIVDVYAINSSVKVLRIDGKLPFDVGYALKGN